MSIIKFAVLRTPFLKNASIFKSSLVRRPLRFCFAIIKNKTITGRRGAVPYDSAFAIMKTKIITGRLFLKMQAFLRVLWFAVPYDF